MQANSKDRIIDSAIMIFSEKGYTETSMRDIAEASGIKAASIYNYFNSKNDILSYIIGLYSNISTNYVPIITDEYIQNNDAHTTLHHLFFTFEEDSSLMYRRILKIFMQEQFRIEEIKSFMKTLYIDSVLVGIKAVLDKMVEYKKINPVDTEIFADILHSINIKSTMTSCHYIDNPGANQHDNWEKALDFVINLIINQ